MQVERILNNDLGILIARSNEGKTMFLSQLINEYKQHYAGVVWVYGFSDVLVTKLKVNSFSSLLELEKITNSIIVIDEVGTLFNLEDRKQKSQIESVLRLVNHNGNKILLSGLPHDFKRFICVKAKCFMFKGLNVGDLINGSLAKEIITQYKGDERGLYNLQIPKDEVLIYDEHYYKEKVTYNKEYDTKVDNVNLFERTDNRTKKSANNVLKKVEVKEND